MTALPDPHRVPAALPPAEPGIARTVALLGGRAAIGRPVRTGLDAHDLLMGGLPAAALMHLTGEVAFLAASPDLLEKAVGISLRTLQRRRKEVGDAPLSVEQGSRTWKFAEILASASALFGSQAEAEAWMNRPAIGLDQRRPIDLLATPLGVAAVEDYLTRIDYGVYA